MTLWCRDLLGFFAAAASVEIKAKAGLNTLNTSGGLHWVNTSAQWLAIVEGENQSLCMALEQAKKLMLGVVNSSITILWQPQGLPSPSGLGG